MGCDFLLQGISPNPGIEPASPALAGRFFTAEPPGKLTVQAGGLNRSGAEGQACSHPHPPCPTQHQNLGNLERAELLPGKRS